MFAPSLVDSAINKTENQDFLIIMNRLATYALLGDETKLAAEVESLSSATGTSCCSQISAAGTDLEDYEDDDFEPMPSPVADDDARHCENTDVTKERKDNSGVTFAVSLVTAALAVIGELGVASSIE